MSIRKYLSEFNLHMAASFTLLAQQDSLESEAAQEAMAEHDFHIYLICKRPRITIDPKHFVVTPELVAGILRVQRGNAFDDAPFVIKNSFGHASFTLSAPYPHNFFEFIAPDGTNILRGKTGLLAHGLPVSQDLLNLEVLYVGQAYGKDGSRTAPARLKSHSTLQGIYATASADYPDHEIWLVLCAFREVLITSFDGTQSKFGTTDDEDRAHIHEVLRTPVSEQQRINFTEAALIRYFDAPFNKNYRDSFPSPAHGTYAACYDIDYNSVSVELDTEGLGCRLYSAAAAPKWVHIPRFPLHSREQRKSMFEFFGADA